MRLRLFNVNGLIARDELDCKKLGSGDSDGAYRGSSVKGMGFQKGGSIG
jgi:hypothetical protein